MFRIRHLIFLLLCTPLVAYAADAVPALEPLPEPPPPPAGYEPDPDTEPQVTILKRGEETIEEYRVNGEMYMMKVTPSHGVPYYLLKQDREAGWARMDGPEAPLSVPKWVLFNF